MTYEFFPKQEELIGTGLTFEYSDRSDTWRNKTKIIGYGGAIRGGKTIGGLALLVILCKWFPGSRWAVVRRTLPDLRRNTLVSFHKLVPDEYLEQSPKPSNQWVARIANPGKESSEIIFFPESYDTDKDLNRWRGLEVNGFLLEEVNELQEESFNKAIERSGTHKMGQTWSLGANLPRVYPSLVIWTCNPSSNWVKSRFYDKWKADGLDSMTKYIPSRVYDNPHVPEEWIEEQRMLLPPLIFEAFVNGNWDINFNDCPFLYSFSMERHIYRGALNDLINANLPIYLSCDQNVEPPVITCWQTGRGWTHGIWETALTTGSVYDLADQVKKAWPNFRFKITGDAAGYARSVTSRSNASFYEILCRELGLVYEYDLIAPHSNERHEDSRILCNTVLHSHPQFYIHQSCNRLIQDMQNARVDKLGQLEKDRKDPSKFLDHFDTFRYAVATFFPDYLESPRKYW